MSGCAAFPLDSAIDGTADALEFSLSSLEAGGTAWLAEFDEESCVVAMVSAWHLVCDNCYRVASGQTAAWTG